MKLNHNLLQGLCPHRPILRVCEDTDLGLEFNYLRNTLLLFVFSFSINFAFAQKKVENLNRGLVAVRVNADSVFLSWRLLGNENDKTKFDVFLGNEKINKKPLKATNFIDVNKSDESYTVKISKGVNVGDNQTVSVWQNNFLEIPLNIPQGGTMADGKSFSYNANDASVADLDGDGEYEIILKWDPWNSKDNSQAGVTGNVYIDAYKMNGKQLWRVNLGRNIRAGAHYTQFMVYDFDSDGKAEMVCKTADGTIDGIGKVIGDSSKNYINAKGFILEGDEFLTIFNGQTGAAMSTVNYDPPRGDNGSKWGDRNGNRVDRFVACVAYLDGQNPSIVMGRGYYTRLVRVAYDFKNGQLVKRWTFDSDTDGKDYEHQGNHQLSVADVDGDGKDEIINGSSIIDDNGKGLFNCKLGHGDAMHVSDMNLDNKGLELWQSHESPREYGDNGMEMRDLKTGKVLWGVDGQKRDVGRCMASDIDPNHLGYECWGAVGGLYNAKGEKISDAKPRSMNFAVWWDGDLTRELLDKNYIEKWNPATQKLDRIFTADGFTSNNGTKANPCLSGDILGDWREEVILRKTDNTALRIYTTTIPTAYKFRTLAHDPQYRVALAWQNTAYNQPPHPSFYLGNGMKKLKLEKVEIVK